MEHSVANFWRQQTDVNRFDINAFFDDCKTIQQIIDRIDDTFSSPVLEHSGVDLVTYWEQQTNWAPHIGTLFKGTTSKQQRNERLDDIYLLKDPLWRVQSATKLARTLFGKFRTPEDFSRQVKTVGPWGPWDSEGISTAQVKHTVGKSKLQSTLFKRKDNIVFKVETLLLTPLTHSEMSSAEGVQDASGLTAELTALTVGSKGKGKESSGDQNESKDLRLVFEEHEWGGCTLACILGDFKYVEGWSKSGKLGASLHNQTLGIYKDLDEYIFTGLPATEGSELSEDWDWVTLVPP